MPLSPKPFLSPLMNRKMPDSALAALKSAILRLKNAGVDEAELDAKYIVCHVLGVPAHALYTDASLTISRKQQRTIDAMLNKRVQGRPVQYILGDQAFYGLSFKVSPHVLIPRPETELLVEKVLEKAKDFAAPSILDLCTGSGCIAVAIKSKLAKAAISASDISFFALWTARKNAQLNHTDVRFLKSNLFGQISGRFDIIVTNPPYINQSDYAALDPKVRNFEPKGALLGGQDGLDLIRRIIRQAPEHLKAGGWLLMEMGHDQREAAERMMAENGFAEIQTFQDYSGFDRIVTGKKN